MRLAIGSIMHEANTFSPVPTRLADFERGGFHVGEEVVVALADVNCEVAGFLDVLRPEGVSFAPILSARSLPGGAVTGEAFGELRDRLISGLRAAGDVDGVLLALHGAMVADGEDDADGAILQAVRDVVGESVPIGLSLDMHANITGRKVALADLIIGYHSEPHVDMREVGQGVALLLLGLLAGRIRPVMAWRKLPMIGPPETHDTVDGPMAEAFQLIARIEEEPGILAASLFPVQPFMDIEDLGWSVVVVADRDAALAEGAADRIARFAWDSRERFLFEGTPVEEALARARSLDGGPVILVDSADSPNAGATGDSTAVLKALLESGFDQPTLLTVSDAQVADRAFQAGLGAELSVELGGKRGEYPSIPITARVRSLSDGRYVQEGPVGKGAMVDMKGVAVLEAGSLLIVVGRSPDPGHDPQVYRSLGLEPREAKVVVVKSPADFRASYGAFAREIIFLDTPGPASSNLERFHFRRAPRPLFPLDRGPLVPDAFSGKAPFAADPEDSLGLREGPKA